MIKLLMFNLCIAAIAVLDSTILIGFVGVSIGLALIIYPAADLLRKAQEK